MKTVCKKNKCTGCMACTEICPKNAIKIEDAISTYNAVIQDDICIQCGACYKVCQVNQKTESFKPTSWVQGWIRDPQLRKKSSSGGAARALSDAIIDDGGVVYSCTFKEGEFIYEAATTKEELSKFSGSKYVKSNPIGIYKQIRERLKTGVKVLFIGLPCHVSALKHILGEQENLITVDLICHGTPSPKLLEIYLNQQGIRLDDLDNISFRTKSNFRLNSNKKYINKGSIRDSYSIAFLDGLTYTDNCYSCQYAMKKRVSDITIGDSWGSKLDVQEQKKGLSLVLCQTLKGENLLKKSDFHIEKVDLDRAIECNHQLSAPVKKHKSTDIFFKALIDQQNFDNLVRKYLPIAIIKQYIKLILFGWRKDN